MKAPALAEAAIDLSWLSPSAGSLAALVRLPAAEAWVAVRGDPGMVLLWVRQLGNLSSAPSFAPITLRHSFLLQKVLEQLNQPGFVDWNRAELFPVYRACYLQAAAAHAIASRVTPSDADCAWIAGLLTPLGWLAVSAVDSEAIAACRGDLDFCRDSAAVQRQYWGLDHTALVRRLCRRWNLPLWLSAIIGQLGLPAGIAHALGADARLFQITQLAVALVQEQKNGLGLAVGALTDELVSSLGLSSATLDEIRRELLSVESRELVNKTWSPPSGARFLADFLQLSCTRLGWADEWLLQRLDLQIDQLYRALEEQCRTEKERLRDLKLQALGEFAAGAGHEINNPLAVISGQAQYLIARESDPGRVKALQTIVVQTRRIHQILTDLMQFSRPAPPKKQIIEIGELVGDVLESLRAQAEQMGVELRHSEALSATGCLFADPAQARSILSALLRNALEAAPANGWAKLSMKSAGQDTIEFVIEDNGQGPSPTDREHMFDPFFSGRSAGRGRGLGLTTAWRLAQLHDGQVRYDGHVEGITRFVLRLPLVAAAAQPTSLEFKSPPDALPAVA